MEIKIVDETPRQIVRFDQKPDETMVELSPAQVEHVAEIFNTPLTGSYNWDYTVADDRILKLYELGKKLNWNVELDVDWSVTPDWDKKPALTQEQIAAQDQFLVETPWNGLEDFDKMSRDEKLEFFRHDLSWSLSQFLHGEQGALLVASQLISCAPTYNAKLYAASQAFDEARHVEFFNKLMQNKIGFTYPVARGLKSLLDKILTDPRWDLKFIGMQIIIEGLALAAFNTAKNDTEIEVLKNGLELIIRDEARHVTFGVNYLEEYISTLTEKEKDDRAQFAYEACIVARDRLVQNDVYRHFGWDVEKARNHMLAAGLNSDFLNFLYTRIMPNLKRIGLLTDKIRPKFEEMGILEFEDFPTDGDIDWSNLERPLFEDKIMAATA
ncbi:MAG: ferritin-like domain-containing protein [Pseudomonadales bacterium]|nr:ferritin-like domain-containing protein [Pseudomonadales bacterium]